MSLSGLIHLEVELPLIPQGLSEAPAQASPYHLQTPTATGFLLTSLLNG